MSKRILIVDDDKTIRNLVLHILQKEGYAVETATNGLEALQVIDTNPPDLVICDIMMPELSGLEMAQGLRYNPTTQRMPIIFITASEESRHFTESVNLKARYFLTKPFNNDKLVEKVQKILGPP